MSWILTRVAKAGRLTTLPPASMTDFSSFELFSKSNEVSGPKNKFLIILTVLLG